MTCVKTSCSVDKKPLEMLPKGCHVTIRVPGRITLEFFCPRCGSFEVKDINNTLVEGLRMLGVPVQLLEVPEEATEKHAGRPITLTEVNTLIAELWATDEFVMPPPRRALFRR